MSVLGQSDVSSEQKSKNTSTASEKPALTPKQQLKQDAMLWAEFLYSEYKRKKALIEEVQTMPTHYDNPDA